MDSYCKIKKDGETIEPNDIPSCCSYSSGEETQSNEVVQGEPYYTPNPQEIVVKDRVLFWQGMFIFSFFFMIFMMFYALQDIIQDKAELIVRNELDVLIQKLTTYKDSQFQTKDL